MNLQFEKKIDSLPETFQDNITRVVYAKKFETHYTECQPYAKIKIDYETPETTSGYSACLRLILSDVRTQAEMDFILPVFTSGLPPELLPCLITKVNQDPLKNTLETIPDSLNNTLEMIPDSLNNTLEMIMYGWMHIIKTIGELTAWNHDIKSSEKYGEECNTYTMIWKVLWGVHFFPRSDRMFTIKSSLDKKSNMVKFTLQIDRNIKVLEFGIHEVNNLINHIKKQLEFRFGFSERYNYQLQRIELLLQDTNIA